MGSTLTGLAIGGLGGGAAAGIMGGGMGKFGFGKVKDTLGDILLGKKKKAPTLKRIPLTAQEAESNKLALQQRQRGASEVEAARKDLLGTRPTEAIERARIQKQQKAITSSEGDARRRLRKLVARRGLQRSSIGQAQETALRRQSSEKQGMLGAELPGRLQAAQRQFALQRAQLGAGQSQLGNVPMAKGQLYMPGQAKRQGGISGLVGAGIGGYFGGPQGAAVGGQIGSALPGMFN